MVREGSLQDDQMAYYNRPEERENTCRIQIKEMHVAFNKDGDIDAVVNPFSMALWLINRRNILVQLKTLDEAKEWM